MDKVEVYIEIVKLFSDFSTPKLNKKQQLEVVHNITKQGMQLALLAPDSVVSAYNKWRHVAVEGGTPEEIVDEFAALMLTMREDLQSIDNSNIGKHDMRDIFMSGVL